MFNLNKWYMIKKNPYVQYFFLSKSYVAFLKALTNLRKQFMPTSAVSALFWKSHLINSKYIIS